MPIYRYKSERPGTIDAVELSRYLPDAVVSIADARPSVCIDIDCPATSKTDLDAYMAGKGFDYLGMNPATPLDEMAHGLISHQQLGSLQGGTTTERNHLSNAQVAQLDDAIHDNVSGEVNAIAAKAVPVAADLLLIEDSAASFAKKKITIGDLPGGGGSGDVVGPASATDHAVARYDGTTGKLIQDSVVIVSDTGAIDGVECVDANVLTGAGKPAHLEGRYFYDGDEHTLAVYNDEAEMTHQLGQEGVIRVYNNTGVTVLNGQVCYVSGSEGVENRPTIALGRADASSTSRIIGVATHDIEHATFGYLTSWGLVNGLDTSTFGAGDPLFLDEVTAGTYRNTPPPAGNYEIFIGYCVRVHATEGRILVRTAGAPNGTTAGATRELNLLVQKGSPGTINAGEVVRVVGWDNGVNLMEVELADASSVATMPALGIARESFTNTSSGEIVALGDLANIVDTSSYSPGTRLYVSETAGQATNIRPTGAALVQQIGVVAKSSTSQGVVNVIGPGSEYGLPNLPNNKLWIGSGGVPVEVNRGGIDDVAIHTDVSGEVAGLTEKVSPANGDWLLLESVVDSNAKRKVQVGNLPGGGGGEVNTASNVGTGADVFKQKTGVDLEFRGINAASAKISAVVNLDNIDLDVPDASTTAKGAVELATDGESAAGVVVQGNDSRLSNARAPTGAAGGSLTGTYPNPGVADGADATAIHDNVSGEISAIAEKVTPVAADLLIIEDSAAANAKKRVQIGNLPGGGSGHTIQDEGVGLAARTNLNFIGAGVTATDNPGADATDVTISGGGGSETLAALQARRTTIYTATASFVSLTLDATDFENDPAVVKHNDTTTSRIDILVDGDYRVAYALYCGGDASLRTTQTRIIKNGTTALAGTHLTLSSDGANTTDTPLAFIAEATVSLVNGDYLQLQVTDTASIIVKAGAVFTATKLDGVKGDTGATGSPGADGDITWQGTWVSQNYTTNQAVYYAPTGQSYVCKLNTVASENPTNTTYWDILAQKGGMGGPQFYSESEAYFSSTSLSWVQASKHTTGSLGAGNYIIQYSCEVAGQNLAEFRVHVDDTTEIGYTIPKQLAAGNWVTFAGFRQLNLGAGTHDIDFDVKHATPDIAEIRRMRITVWSA